MLKHLDKPISVFLALKKQNLIGNDSFDVTL